MEYRRNTRSVCIRLQHQAILMLNRARCETLYITICNIENSRKHSNANKCNPSSRNFRNCTSASAIMLRAEREIRKDARANCANQHKKLERIQLLGLKRSFSGRHSASEGDYPLRRPRAVIGLLQLDV